MRELIRDKNRLEHILDHIGKVLSAAMLMPMNIEARYPEYKQKLALTLNQQVCKNIIEETKALQIWIKNRLSEL